MRQKQIKNTTAFAMSNGKKGCGRGKKRKGELFNVSVVLAGEIVEGLIMGIVEGLKRCQLTQEKRCCECSVFQYINSHDTSRHDDTPNNTMEFALQPTAV